MKTYPTVACSQFGRSRCVGAVVGFFFGVEGGGVATGAATFRLGGGIGFGFGGVWVDVDGADWGADWELVCNLASRFKRIFFEGRFSICVGCVVDCTNPVGIVLWCRSRGSGIRAHGR